MSSRGSDSNWTTGMWASSMSSIGNSARSTENNGYKMTNRMSRVMMLYTRKFGVNGTHFCWKVLAAQLLTIVLQSTARLPLLGAMAWTAGPNDDQNDHRTQHNLAASAFWFYVAALAANAIVPSVLLHSRRTFVQREVLLYVDIVLDFVYLFTLALLALCLNMAQLLVPRNPLQFLSIFTPLIHIHIVLKNIDVAAAQRAKRRDDDVKGMITLNFSGGSGGSGATYRRTRANRIVPVYRRQSTDHDIVVKGVVEPMPRWATASFTLTGLAVIALVLLTQCNDRFPFAPIDPCYPCTCTDVPIVDPYFMFNGTLNGTHNGTHHKNGTYHSDAGYYTDFDGHDHDGGSHSRSRGGSNSGANGIGMSDTNTYGYTTRRVLESCSLVERVGAFQQLDLNSKGIDEVKPGAFNGLWSLRALGLRNNSLAELKEGTLKGLDNVRTIMLDDNELELEGVPPTTFLDKKRSLKYLWVQGNRNLSCAQLTIAADDTDDDTGRVFLRRKVECVDTERCDLGGSPVRRLGWQGCAPKSGSPADWDGGGAGLGGRGGAGGGGGTDARGLASIEWSETMEGANETRTGDDKIETDDGGNDGDGDSNGRDGRDSDRDDDGVYRDEDDRDGDEEDDDDLRETDVEEDDEVGDEGVGDDISASVGLDDV